MPAHYYYGNNVIQAAHTCVLKANTTEQQSVKCF